MGSCELGIKKNMLSEQSGGTGASLGSDRGLATLGAAPLDSHDLERQRYLRPY